MVHARLNGMKKMTLLEPKPWGEKQRKEEKKQTAKADSTRLQLFALAAYAQ